ncbi:hypothetical protein J2752_002632 [Halarchaeum rubridurum]|uniref:Nucleotide modification associated domain-containing protein n=1 Tax=Halarchaeum rubridurum TaxID=489911 RepID=A0A830G3U2_9EURY|nr:hypothetical protein [Halarchaeum rubridurum]MBP1955703.1 hypothetical protein [Halarchaeum rubridurum]GGM74019.1 hypothetical protein GCM10009017_25010 [Halarchaeum rubridurum]
MTSYLIRVGLDSTDAGGKGLGPVARSSEFDYIPIPDSCDTSEPRNYHDLDSRIGESPPEFVGVGTNRPVHMDPEFETYTYGEVGDNKCASLNKMESGDLLVFCAGLKPTDGLDRPRMYAIGYFTVQAVHDLEGLSPSDRGGLLKKFSNNAHVKREGLGPETLHPSDPDRDRYPVIVSGDPDQSRLLDRAVSLSSATATGTDSSWFQKYRPLGVAEDLLGLNATDLKRSNPKKIRGSPGEVRDWLDSDVEVEAGRRYSPPKVYLESTDDQEAASGRPKLRSYVVDSDSGFAPHIKNGLLSLATCKPMIRSSTKVGDWVVGVGGSDHDSSRQIVHAFRVEQTLSMKEYFVDERFEHRRPDEDENPRGDNIYAPREMVERIERVSGDQLPDDSGAAPTESYERGYVDDDLCYTHVGGAYFQLAEGGHSLDNYQTDVKKQGDREKVLLSADYYYFGDDGTEIPKEIASLSVPGYGDHDGRRNHRREPSGRVDDITPFVDWLRNHFRPGRHGTPVSREITLDPEETSGPGC